MWLIGLTGGIASGKSSVAAYLRELGAAVFDADACSRQVVAKGTEGLEEVRQALGYQYLRQDGELDRAKVAKLIFAEPEARKKLEQIIHTRVRQAESRFIKEQLERGGQVVVLDVPLLIETGTYRWMDKVWLVSLSQKEQVRRAMLRDGSTREQVQARLKAQLSFEEKAKFADLVLDNSGTLLDTKRQVFKAWRELQSGDGKKALEAVRILGQV